MATLKDIRRRVSSVRNTQKITRAMKMVAAAKLRRAQEAIVSTRPYARTIKNLLQHLAEKVDVTSNPLFAVRPVEHIALIVVTSDRGLCGAFNTNVVKSAVTHAQTAYKEAFDAGRLRLICVGKRGFDFFGKRNYKITNKHIGIFGTLNFAVAQAIMDEVVQGFTSGDYDRVEVIYNEFKSIAHQRVAIEQLLPIPTETGDSQSQTLHPPEAGSGLKSLIDYIYEPSREAILASIVPKHLNFQMWRVLLESSAAEQGARMTAMELASRNCQDMIESQTLFYHKARQAAITRELTDIVGAVESIG